MQDFRQLKVWQKAHQLALDVHDMNDTLPKGRATVVRNQCLRAVLSIPANIAEGCGKTSSAEFIRYLDIASGSTREVEHHLITLRDLRLLDRELHQRLEAQVIEIRKMLQGLIRAIRRQPPKDEL